MAVVEVVGALIPVFLAIGLGWLLKRRGIFGDDFWADVERLVFYFLFPALLVTAIAGAETAGLRVLPMGAALFLAAAATAAVAAILGQGMHLPGPARATLVQGATRPNTYVGLAVAAALFGDGGLTLSAIAIVAVIPLVNVVGVLAHTYWVPPVAANDPGTMRDEAATLRRALWIAAKNPIVIACLVGAALNVLGIGLPPLVGPTLEILGRAALPLGLMAVGAGLRTDVTGQQAAVLRRAVVLKFALLPFATLIGLWLFDVDGLSRTVAMIYAALPVSASAYVTSRQLGGDAPTMAGIVTTTTLIALVVLPLAALLF